MLPSRISPTLIIILLSAFTLLVFRPFFQSGWLPVPYDMLVGWYFPYNQGGWEGYQPGIPYKGGLYAADVFRQIIPWKKLATEQILQGKLPLWNPYSFSGEPLLANPQVMVFHPSSIIFYFLPFDLAWSLLIISAPFLAGFFSYLFLKSLNASTLGSIIGALSFAFSGHILSWLQWGVTTNVIIWLPLLLYALTNYLQSRHTRFLILVTFATYSIILGGYPQEAFYCLLIATFFSGYLIYTKHHLRTVLPLLLASALAVFIALPQLLPTYRLFKLSALNTGVSQQLFLSTTIEPARLLTLFSPDYFGNRITNNYWADSFSNPDYIDTNIFIGTTAVFFLILAMLTKLRSSFLNFFIGIAVVGLLLTIKSPLTQLLSHLSIPLLTTGSASGALVIVSTSLAFASAFGISNKTLKLSKLRTFFPLIIYSLVLLYSLLTPPEFRRTTLRNLVIPYATITSLTLILLFFQHQNYWKKLTSLTLKHLIPLLFATLIVSLHLFETTRYSQKMLSFSDPAYAYPDHPLIETLRSTAGNYRTVGFWEGDIATNLSTAFNIYSPEGYNPLHLLTYQELFSRAHVQKPHFVRSDADIPDSETFTKHRLLQLTSTRYITAKVIDPQQIWEEEIGKFDPQLFTLIWQQAKYKIYDFPSALPRASLFNQFETIPNKPQRLDRLFDPSWNPYNSIILEEDPSELIDSQATGSAKITSYQPNQVKIETDTTGTMLLLLTDNYYPSWVATIDSQPTTIYRANHTFRAVRVPPGKHEITYSIHWP